MVTHILDTDSYVFIHGRLVCDRGHQLQTEAEAAEELDADPDRFLIKTGKEIKSCPQQLNVRASKLEPVFTQSGQLFLYFAERSIQLEAVFPVKTKKVLRIRNVDLKAVELIGLHEGVPVTVQFSGIGDSRLISGDYVGPEAASVHDLEDPSSVEHTVKLKNIRVIMHGGGVGGTSEIPVREISQARHIVFVPGYDFVFFCPEKLINDLQHFEMNPFCDESNDLSG